MRLRFLHIGLPKCGSTFLQRVWAHHPDLTSVNLTEPLQAIRAEVAIGGLGGRGPAHPVPPPPPNANPAGGNPASVKPAALCASNEGFLHAYLNRPDAFDKITPYFRTVAKWVHDNALTEDVVIVVRDPVAWLRSMHEQAVKEGGSEAASTFMTSHDAFLRQHLDLAGILEIWGGFGIRCHVLPLENLREDEEGFFGRLESLVGAPIPPAPIREAVGKRARSLNASMGERLIGLADLNRRARAVLDTIQASEAYKADQPNEAALVPQMRVMQNFANRRFTEYADDATYWELIDKDQGERERFLGFSVTPDLAAHIRTRFLEPLAGIEGFTGARLDRYTANLSDKTTD
jgi:hypothetical protein